MTYNVLFLTACAACKSMAKDTGVLCVVVVGDFGGFTVLQNYQAGWLFRAYPGGRTVLSVEGNKLT